MSLKFDLQALVEELDRTHGERFSVAGSGIPSFVTARSGPQRFFTTAAGSMLRTVATTMFQNRSASAIRVEIAPFTKVVTQVVADLHVEEAFADIDQDPDGRALGVLKAEVESRLEQAGEVYTHHFPAWTQGFERIAPIHLGPVRFASREDWVGTVDFPGNAKDDYLNEAPANHRWKEIVLDALGKPRSEVELAGLAGPIYDVIRACPAVLSVTIQGFEQHFSRKLARIVCKSALDATSLFFENSELFRQQTLHDERLPPLASSSGFIETNGYLWLPGLTLNRHPVMPYEIARGVWDGMAKFHAPVGEILRALVEPSNHPHPRLASRWATALDWLAEGCREVSDAVALAKVGTTRDLMVTDSAARFPQSPVRWRIDAAHVFVLPDSADLEAIHLVDLDVEEGREEAVPDRDDRPDAWSLRYYCTVRPRGASAPDAWVGAAAAVTIVGIDAGGATVTMVGRALFGRGDDGAFEIEFGAAPSMTTWHKDGHAAATPN